MAAKYREYSGLNLPALEKEILEHWQQEQAFEKSVSLREGATPFVFYEGPPSANGMPGIHHVISRTLKDLVCRYKTMQGFQVKRKGGWDTHGLPVELQVEKELGITKEDIGKKITVEEYNQKCRETVLRYKDKWDDLTNKMGYWVDLKNPYITFENNYIESLWWILKQLYYKDLLYESVSIQPYSPAAGTGLSSHELNQPGCYKDVKDTSTVAMFRVAADESNQSLFVTADNPALNNTFFLAWTTTPWTLPSNLGLTVGPNIEYVLVKTFNPYTALPSTIIMAKALLHKYFPEHVDEWKEGDNEKLYEVIHEWLDGESVENVMEGNVELKAAFDTLVNKKKYLPYKVIASFTGKELEGVRYEQLFQFEANRTDNPNAFQVMLGDFVTTEDGTGIVHTAPAFGADDYKVGRKYDIGMLTMVDRQGKFVDGLGEFSNRYVKNYKDDPTYVDVNVDISVELKRRSQAFKVEKYDHSYPHCWRTDKPILYYPLDAWFIRTTALKDRMVALNKTINWKPASTGTGRFGNWLENMVDWNLSRSRFWGTPLPVWKNLAFYKKEDDLGRYDSVYVGNKKDLINNVSKDGAEVEGYLVNFEKLYTDIQNEEPSLINSINSYNDSLGNLREVFGVDINQLKESISKKGLDKSALKDDIVSNVLTIEIIENYCSKLDEVSVSSLDLHKPFIDNVVFVRKNESGRDYVYVRVDDLVDVWFDSGAMPYAQWHFPFENKEIFAQNYPADFIAEGVDQTRGWFYTLHAIGSLIKESVEEELSGAGLPVDKVDGRAYKTVVSNGLVLDKNGIKMSKRLGNIVDPFATIETFGADATRWYLITNASPWDNLKFDIDGIKEVQRRFFGTLYNTYQFFALYANVDGFAFTEAYIPVTERPEIDRWILSSLNTLVQDVTCYMDDYEPTAAGRAVETFVDEHLSNWYVRLCRRRFWKGEYEQDKISAYQTLYECLETVVRLIAPIAPFFSDAVFANLNMVSGKDGSASVHHAGFPKADETVIDKALEERMQLAQDASSLILSIRKKVNIKVRQPLQKALIPVLNPAMKIQLQKIEDLIKAEVNVKEMEYLADTEGFIKKKIKPNFIALGKKLGPKMKLVTAALAGFNQHDIATLERDGQIEIPLNDEPFMLRLDEVDISAEDIPGWSVATNGALTVALDITLTDELRQEGEARELVNRIQNIRKDKGLNLIDRIDVKLSANDGLQNSINRYKSYICAEILADSVEWALDIVDGVAVEVNEHQVIVSLTKKED